jgi:sugar/nucleoside kinase (ribokinase family)
LNSADANAHGRPAVVLCAGIAVEDFLFKVDRFPAPGEKVHAEALVATTGGCAVNAAIAVARLGGIARFAGPVGSDEASSRLLNGLERMDVDARGVVQVEGGSISVSGIFIDRDGEKMVATRPGAKLTGVEPPDPAGLVADVDVVLADNRFPQFVAPICAAARARRIPVVLDADRATQLADRLFALASHIIFSSEALRATAASPDPAAGLCRAAETISGFLAVTNGPDDVLWMDAGVVRRFPAFSVRAVDTLGAGDTFHGAFALALAEGSNVLSALRFGAASAALKCTRFGGISGTPCREETEAFLASHESACKE